VEAGGLIVEGVGIALKLHVDLRTANIEEGVVDNFGFEAQPAFKIEVGIDDGDFLAQGHFNFGGGSPIGFEVGHDFGRFDGFAIHLAGSGAMGQGDDAIMGIGGILQEDRFAADIMQQNTGWDHNKVGFTEGKVAIVVE